ncbi:MAG: sugar phosphate isomerase/epimerase family protein [Planctomycetaceae bacterium]
MKLGFVSAILPDEDLETVFQIASELGYQCVELMCWPAGKAQRRYAGVTHVHVDDFDQAAASAVNDLAARYGIAISGIGYYPNALSADDGESQQAVAHIKKCIRAASLLGVNQFNGFIGRDHTKSVNENWPKFLEIWKPLIAFAEDQGVRIGIENCPMLFTRDEWPGGKNLAHSPAIWRRMFDDIPSDAFGLNYDPSHLVFQQMDYLAPMREFADRIFHVHAKDVRVDRHLLNDVGILAEPNQYHFPKLPGLGDVDWGSFFSVLGDVGYRGAVCVEVEDRIYEGDLESRKKSLQQSAYFLRNFIPRP